MKTFLSQMPSYKDFYSGKHTLEIGYPWIAFGAILALERILGGKTTRRTFNILELGSGGSTVFLSRRCKNLLSLEHNKDWYEKVKEALPVPNNVNLVCKPVKELEKLIKKQDDGYFDLVFVDSGYSYEARNLLMNVSINKIKKLGWLLIDNYLFCNRFDYTGFDVYTYDMFQYSGRGTKLCKKLW